MSAHTTKSMAVVIALALAGCATVASHEEYADYRAMRLADNDRDRLIAAQEYADKHAGGFWIEEVQSFRDAREEELWARSSDTREGLEWYRRVYPDGEHFEEAGQRLAALRTVSSRRDEEVQRQRELEEQRRQEAAEARRTWVTRAMQFWVGNLLSIRNYGSPIQRVAAANPDFSQAFGQPPQPSCTPDYCIKRYGQVYHIPVPGATRIDRRIEVYLRLELVRGRVERAELLMPNKGFSRWYEMENQTVVTDEDPEQRMTAINWALDRIQPIIQQVASGAQQIDFVPEPIEPLQLRGQGDTETAPVAPGEEAEAPPQPEQPPEPQAQPQPQEAQPQEEGGLDELLREAAGTGGEQTPAQPEMEAQPEVEPETLVLPISLLAFQHRNLRVVVFAAGEEDYDHGYDGVFLERVRD